MIICLSWVLSSRLAFVFEPRCLPPAGSPVKVTELMRMVMLLTMCHSDKLLHNDALANLVTSFINTGGVSYIGLMHERDYMKITCST